jgi:hypothetical protein
MRGVEVKHVRHKDVDLQKVWDVESATRKDVHRSPSLGEQPQDSEEAGLRIPRQPHLKDCIVAALETGMRKD